MASVPDSTKADGENRIMSEELEAEVAQLLQNDLDEIDIASTDRVERAVAVAHSQLAVKDTLALVVGHMWKALAELMLPMFGGIEPDEDKARRKRRNERR